MNITTALLTASIPFLVLFPYKEITVIAVVPEVYPYVTARTVVTSGAVKRAVVSAYSSTPDQTDADPFINAANRHVRKGDVACPRRLKLGTKVEIQGIVYECADRLAEKYDDRFDIWMETREEANQWGIKKLEVTIQ